nr:SGNH hydrolase domain-containing protein [Pseudomonas allii]
MHGHLQVAIFVQKLISACHVQIPYLCPNGQCMGSKDGVALYYDDNHLVDSGNQQLKGLFRNITN